jgi:DNA-binding CsgD family transcriptional regulator
MVSQDEQLISKILSHHPITRHYAGASRLHPHLVSDFMALKTWTSSGIFDEIYRRLGTPFQLVIPLQLTKANGNIRFLDLARATGDFGVRETDLARVLQGQLISLSRIAAGHDASHAGSFRANRTELSETFGLTPRELEVMELLVHGHTAVAMGHKLGISSRTIEKHLERIYFKTAAHDRLEIARLVWTVAAAPDTPP